MKDVLLSRAGRLMMASVIVVVLLSLAAPAFAATPPPACQNYMFCPQDRNGDPKCGFWVGINWSLPTKDHAFTLPDGTAVDLSTPQGPNTATVTNISTGYTVHLTIPGPQSVYSSPNQTNIYLIGPWLTWFRSPGWSHGLPPLIYNAGVITLYDYLGPNYTVTQVGHLVNVCQLVNH